MATLPEIVVRMIHIKGPLRGEVQEFTEPRISVGRHPSNHIRYPADLTIVSRNHADIIREGNRFKLIDHSTNGTFVNGEKITETFLKNGDVISFADLEKGPKLSFLSEVRKVQPTDVPKSKARVAQLLQPKLHQVAFSETPPAVRDRSVVIEKVQVPLAIQYGPTLRSFKVLPITMGSSPDCDFTLEHPGIFDQHAQIFFYQDQHWIKDLTGQNVIRINNLMIDIQAPLKPDDVITMSEQGPSFRFLGGGRLVEVE